MKRPVLIAGGIWIAAVLLLLFGSAAGLWPNLSNAYLCGWLVLVSLPLGALPILMALELLGLGATPVTGPLRLMLASLPILALLLIPVLAHLHGAYTWQVCSLAHCPSFHYKGFGAHWFTSGFFVGRSIVYLVLWVALSLYFLRPARPSVGRRRLAGAGLALHFVIGTLAAFDWFMSLDEGSASSNYGVLVISAQCAFALTAALLMQLADASDRPERHALVALLVVAAAATFAQYVEYLVVWSANLPKEIAWYQDRATGGQVFAIAGPLLLLLGLVLLLPQQLNSNRVVAAIALISFFLVAFVDLILLASPHNLFVGNFIADLVVVVVLGGLATVCALWLGGHGFGRWRPRHG